MARKFGPTDHTGSSKGAGRGSRTIGTKAGSGIKSRSSGKATAKSATRDASMTRGELRRKFLDDRITTVPVRTSRAGGGSVKVPAAHLPRPDRRDRPLEIIATLPPIHPGEVLREEFLEPMGLSAGQLAKACGVPRTRIERIAAETMGISGDTALRLGRFFGTDPRFWMNLQVRYELETAKASIGGQIAAIRPHQAA